MVAKVCRWLAVALAAIAAATGTAAPSPQPQRIVAVGDLHGDFQAWREIALKARLIDRHNRWAGGASILVQTGDIVDRGPDSLKIIRDLMRLQREAPRAGGRVVVLVGNHEAMNMTGDLRYVTAQEFAAFANAGSARLRERVFETNKAAITAAYRTQPAGMSDDAIHTAWLAQHPLGKLEHQTAWSPRGELGRWTIANRAVAMIGGTLFVHGGISIRYSAIPIDDLNRRVAAALEAREESPTSILNDPFGPLWYRGLVTREPDVGTRAPDQSAATPASNYPSIDDELTAVLRAYGARRIVIAHTPNLSGIQISHGDRLVRIDTGISRYYGGKLSYLEILGDRLVPHNFDRSQPSSGAR